MDIWKKKWWALQLYFTDLTLLLQMVEFDWAPNSKLLIWDGHQLDMYSKCEDALISAMTVQFIHNSWHHLENLDTLLPSEHGNSKVVTLVSIINNTMGHIPWMALMQVYFNAFCLHPYFCLKLSVIFCFFSAAPLNHHGNKWLSKPNEN